MESVTRRLTEALSFMGAHTIIACRSEERARQAIDRMKEAGVAAGKEVNVEFMKLDLASLGSTKKFIKDFKQKNLPLHLLICNAGVLLRTYGRTEDSLEQHFQIMTMFGLQRRLKDCGITVSSLHPGLIKTVLWQTFHEQFWSRLMSNIMGMMGMTISVEQGAVTTINTAVNPALNSQQAIYYSGCRPKQPSTTARNEQYQEELWSTSCDLLKEWMSPDIRDKYGPSTQDDNGQDEDYQPEEKIDT